MEIGEVGGAGAKTTCFNYDAAGSGVKPRGEKRNFGEIEDLSSVRCHSLKHEKGYVS
jgi:hypothetical protein